MTDRSDPLFFTDGHRLEDFSLPSQFSEHLEFDLVRTRQTACPDDYYHALSLAVRDRLIRNWLRTQHAYEQANSKRVFYLSMEFLMGRLLECALINTEYYDECRAILAQQGLVLEDVIDLEKDMGLGNGGLGRLAACFLDSMAVMELPAFGYGIRYEFGIFSQGIDNGYQVEHPDNWLAYGNPWEIERRDLSFTVRFGGRVAATRTPDGATGFSWVDTEDVLAVASDIPVPGYCSNTVNNLRLWQARATTEFSLNAFNRGNYLAAVYDKNRSENISKVLYPNDETQQGKELRLRQEYFFVAASLQDIVRQHRLTNPDLSNLHEQVAIQLNDTHPVMAIPELLRILIDEHGLSWDAAWSIAVATFAYTNHTVVPEALEEWDVALFETLFPRHLQIIYEINHRFLEHARQTCAGDEQVIRDISIIRETPRRTVRMAHLAIVGCHAVNGVAALHSDILRRRLFPHFDALFPGRFVNITNGISPRRWLRAANPMLSHCITERIGDSWTRNLDALQDLEAHLDDEEFLQSWSEIKWARKTLLSQYILQQTGIEVSPDALFDVQIKRIHEYKRQLLNVLHVIDLYQRIRSAPEADWVPRTVVFAGKAAPSYHRAKLIIKLIHCVADTINRDPLIGGRLQVVFLKDYSVTLAELIIPAADLSEQISTAGFEASGTGNMKLSLNGALTIGTLDGANVELLEALGPDNLFLFGLTADQVARLHRDGYRPQDYCERQPALQAVLAMIEQDHFNASEPGLFAGLVHDLRTVDYYCLLADFEDYVRAQDAVSARFRDRPRWTRQSIICAARMGRFSSDRAIGEYNRLIWGLQPTPIPGDRF